MFRAYSLAIIRSFLLYIPVTVHRNKLLFNNQPDALIIQICYKTLHVSGIFSGHHQEFSTVHSALVSFMLVLMTVFKQSQDGTALCPSSGVFYFTFGTGKFHPGF